MAREDLTRRSLISLLAGAAASASGPARALAALQAPQRDGSSDRPARGQGSADAALLPPQGALSSLRLGDLKAGVRTVSPPSAFDLVGVSWRGEAGGIELRTLLADGSWGRWARASTLSHLPEAAELARSGRDDRGIVGDPVWVGPSHTLQLKLSQHTRDVVLHLIDLSSAQASAQAARAFPKAVPILPAGAGQPPILARSSWAGASSVPRVAPEYGDVQLAFVHHTENPNGYLPNDVPGMLRAIFLFHRDVQGWNDIGYNFVIDLFGRIFEARAGGIDEPVVGAQAGGYNAVSTGIAVLGDFSVQPISRAAFEALERLLSWKLGLHGVPIEGHVTVHVDPAGAQYSRYPANAAVSLPRVAGHRDADATICPGDALYGQLPALRKRTAVLAGPPTLATIQLQGIPAEPAPSAEAGGASPGEPASAATQELTGKLLTLGAQAVAGATIEVQAREVSHRGQRVVERSIATVTTGPDGSWSVPVNVIPPPRRKKRKRGRRHPLPPPPVTPVRALFSGRSGVPAAVSAPLEVRGRLSAA